jgi:hypothetical protein
MFSHFPALLVIAVLMLLAALHVFWALGGRWGLASAIPVVEGRPWLEPGPLGTLAVAVLLLLAAGSLGGRRFLQESPWVMVFSVGSWGVVAAFLLRAVGDFRVVGFFKRVRGTRFAELDSTLFAPLCVAIAGLALVVVLGP